MWSCGVILYLMVAGYPPFYSQNRQEVAELIMAGKVEFNGKAWYITCRIYMENGSCGLHIAH